MGVLYERCGRCHGNRHVWIQTFKDGKPGAYAIPREREPAAVPAWCQACGGVGFVPTEFTTDRAGSGGRGGNGSVTVDGADTMAKRG